MKYFLIFQLLFTINLNAVLPFAGGTANRFKLSKCRECFDGLNDDFRIESRIEERLDARLGILGVENQMAIVRSEMDAYGLSEKNVPLDENSDSEAFLILKDLYLCFLMNDKKFAKEVVRRHGRGFNCKCDAPLRVALYEYMKKG